MAVIELFVKSRILDAVPAVTETSERTGEAPMTQIPAPTASRGLRFLPQAHQHALDRMTMLAAALHEELVVWDTATSRGRRAAHRKGVRTTPAVLRGAQKPESVAAFTRAASAALATLETSRD